MVKIMTVILMFALLQDLVNCWGSNYKDYKKLRQKMLAYEEAEGLTEEEIQKKLALIFPGTKWCGPSNKAKNYDDLGSSDETDACCREHDLCPDVIIAGYTKYNLTNTAYYTRLHCSCEKKFRLCLRKVDSTTSSTIGKTYFNMLGTKCFELYYPIVGCNVWGGWFNVKCVENIYNYDERQKYQWFDVPKY